MIVDFLIAGRIEYAFPSRRNFELTAAALADVEDALQARGYIIARRSDSLPEAWHRDGLRFMRERGYSIFLGYRHLSAHDLIRRLGELPGPREEEVPHLRP